MALIPQIYMDSVVAIGKKENDKINWIGTGFIVSKAKDDQNQWIYLITNKHVVKEKKSIWIKVHNDEKNRDVEIEVPLINNAEISYSEHPNPDIDIIAVLLNGNYFVRNKLSVGYIDIDKNAMSSEELRNHGVYEGNLAYMLGYPMGFVNVNSKSPICRMGCIARMTKEQIEESNNILMDIQNFPGNSGSPVVLKPEIISIKGTPHFPQSVLIGIIHSYIPYKDILISRQTGENVEIRTENSGLANMHPVEYIREVVNMEFERLNRAETEKK